MKELTIVIPIREGGNADITLLSLQRQTFQDFEVVVVHDEWSNANKARNAGFEKVATPYVLFSDDDISWYPGALESMMNVLRTNRHASYVYGSYEMGGRLYCDRTFDAEALRRSSYISTMSIIRSAHFPGFDPELKRLQDWDLFLSMLAKGFKGINCGGVVFSTEVRNGITYGDVMHHREAERIVIEKHSKDPRPFLVAVYTLFRERAIYSAQLVESLRKKAGYQFDHYCFDNGSEDYTPRLLSEYEPCWRGWSQKNLGISIGSNLCLDAIFTHGGYDLIIKIDNDCLIQTDDILAKLVEIYKTPGSDRFVLSPRVEGIITQPKRAYTVVLAGHQVGLTGIVGGLFHCVPASIYGRWKYPEDLPMASRQDDVFMEWLNQQDIKKGYVEDLVVEHIDGTHGQCAKMPAYFERKWREEKMLPGEVTK